MSHGVTILSNQGKPQMAGTASFLPGLQGEETWQSKCIKSHGAFKNAHFIPIFDSFFPHHLKCQIPAQSSAGPWAPGSRQRDMLNCSSSLHDGDSELCQGHQNNSTFVPDRLFLHDPSIGKTRVPPQSCEPGDAAAGSVLPGSSRIPSFSSSPSLHSLTRDSCAWALELLGHPCTAEIKV